MQLGLGFEKSGLRRIAQRRSRSCGCQSIVPVPAVADMSGEGQEGRGEGGDENPGRDLLFQHFGPFVVGDGGNFVSRYRHVEGGSVSFSADRWAKALRLPKDDGSGCGVVVDASGGRIRGEGRMDDTTVKGV